MTGFCPSSSEIRVYPGQGGEMKEYEAQRGESDERNFSETLSSFPDWLVQQTGASLL